MTSQLTLESKLQAAQLCFARTESGVLCFYSTDSLYDSGAIQWSVTVSVQWLLQYTIFCSNYITLLFCCPSCANEGLLVKTKFFLQPLYNTLYLRGFQGASRSSTNSNEFQQHILCSLDQKVTITSCCSFWSTRTRKQSKQTSEVLTIVWSVSIFKETNKWCIQVR